MTKEEIEVELKDKKRILYNLRRRRKPLSIKDMTLWGDTVMDAAKLQHHLNHYNYPKLDKVCGCGFKVLTP